MHQWLADLSRAWVDADAVTLAILIVWSLALVAIVIKACVFPAPPMNQIDLLDVDDYRDWLREGNARPRW